MKPVLNQEHLNNAADNNKQPERRLSPSGRSAVVGSYLASGGKTGLCLIYLLINNERGQVTIYNIVLFGIVPLYTLYLNKKC